MQQYQQPVQHPGPLYTGSPAYYRPPQAPRTTTPRPQAYTNGPSVSVPYPGMKGGPRATPYRAAAVTWTGPTTAPQPAPLRYTQPQPAYPTSYGQQRVPTAASPANTNSSSSSNTGSQSGTISTSLSNSNNTSGQPQQLSKTNLYIRGLTQNTTDKDLVNMCLPFGSIISTKAILDKTTNKCRGYGFVDFESHVCAETAVKALQAKGIQAQMAKVGITQPRASAPQQEQDPTNLYIANLPPHFKETDLDSLLNKYGQVVSTRILRDPDGVSKGVGFARMESKEKCEQIINLFNNQTLQGSKEPLLVKFADGGQKKRSPFRNDNRIWRDATEALCAQGGQLTYDPTGLTQNGVAQHMIPAAYNRYTSQPLSTYPLHSPAHWPMQYVMHAPPQNHGVLQMMAAQDPSAVQYTSMIPQLTTQMHALQLTATPPYLTSAAPYPFYPAPSIIHAAPLPLPDNEHNSNTASPEEAYTTYPPPK